MIYHAPKPYIARAIHTYIMNSTAYNANFALITILYLRYTPGIITCLVTSGHQNWYR